jgi:hypothetical protein
VGKPAYASPQALGGGSCDKVGWSHGGRVPEARHRGLLVPRRPPLLERGRAAPHFADAQEEQQLWEGLRDHGASLNRVLNEALRIHGGPRGVFSRYDADAFFLVLSFSRLFLVA